MLQLSRLTNSKKPITQGLWEGNTEETTGLALWGGRESNHQISHNCHSPLMWKRAAFSTRTKWRPFLRTRIFRLKSKARSDVWRAHLVPQDIIPVRGPGFTYKLVNTDGGKSFCFKQIFIRITNYYKLGLISRFLPVVYEVGKALNTTLN